MRDALSLINYKSENEKILFIDFEIDKLKCIYDH